MMLRSDESTRSVAHTSRRTFLTSAAGGALVGMMAPTAWIRRAHAAGRVIVRTIGGSYEEAVTKAIFEPFTKSTGIEVVKVPATLGKIVAMIDAGRVEVDVVDLYEYGALAVSKKGGFERLDYKSWKVTNPEDIDAAYRRPDMVVGLFTSEVLGYNTQTFPSGKHPRSWAEFWDTAKFPGPRMLADLASGSVGLEFALLADGVPKSKLYPIDVDRAFKSLDRVRPSIRKFWDTGALSAQMLADKEVVLGSIWNGRIQTAIDKGLPLGIEWNEAMLITQVWAILKNPPNPSEAQRFVEFACQPEIQVALAKEIPYGPSNRQAFKLIPGNISARLPSSPEHLAQAFLQNSQWWADNRQIVSERWSQWLLKKS